MRTLVLVNLLDILDNLENERRRHARNLALGGLKRLSQPLEHNASRLVVGYACLKLITVSATDYAQRATFTQTHTSNGRHDDIVEHAVLLVIQ